ncbi:hypothetical protein LIA77_04616 [Sarocladium implicatum]|nr:hypothetical protein LIA77_04616 [Sarocladium implicatum]
MYQRITGRHARGRAHDAVWPLRWQAWSNKSTRRLLSRSWITHPLPSPHVSVSPLRANDRGTKTRSEIPDRYRSTPTRLCMSEWESIRGRLWGWAWTKLFATKQGGCARK